MLSAHHLGVSIVISGASKFFSIGVIALFIAISNLPALTISTVISWVLLSKFISHP